MSRVFVIGSGLAGITAALKLADANIPVTMVSFGMGGVALSQGTIDILGYAPDRVDNPIDAIASLPSQHPYHLVGASAVAESVRWIQARLGSDILVGDPECNVLVATALGVLRPTALTQPSIPDLSEVREFAVVDVRQLKDFRSRIVAGNLARATRADGSARAANAATIDYPVRPDEQDAAMLEYAKELKDPAVATGFARRVAAVAGEGEVVVIPPVVSYAGATDRVTEIIGRPLAEALVTPQAPPSRRLYELLMAKARAAGVRVMLGAKVVGCGQDGERVTSLQIAQAGGVREVPVAAVVHAPGGFEAGAISVDSYRHIEETTFGLPLTKDSAMGLVNDEHGSRQPLFDVGVRVDEDMKVCDDSGPVYANLYAAGGILAGAQRWAEKSGDGVAIASGYRAAQAVEENA